MAKKLIEKGAIRQGTVFEASYKTNGLSCVNNSVIVGEFILITAKASPEGVIFEALDEKNIPRRINTADVTSLDGMDVARVAAIYNLADEGSEVKTAKRRGRKPKSITT